MIPFSLNKHTDSAGQFQTQRMTPFHIYQMNGITLYFTFCLYSL
jgi:hypothetical protein